MIEAAYHELHIRATPAMPEIWTSGKDLPIQATNDLVPQDGGRRMGGAVGMVHQRR
jgi:hypothetical protein